MNALTSFGLGRALAKNTLADFKISFARRNSLTSRRNERISSRSLGLNSSPRPPLSTSACLTALRNVSRSIPRSAATCAIGHSLSSASLTPRSINSGGYFLVLVIPEGSPLPRTYPRNRASVKTGLAHPIPAYLHSKSTTPVTTRRAPDATGIAKNVRTPRRCITSSEYSCRSRGILLCTLPSHRGTSHLPHTIVRAPTAMSMIPRGIGQTVCSRLNCGRYCVLSNACPTDQPRRSSRRYTRTARQCPLPW